MAYLAVKKKKQAQERFASETILTTEPEEIDPSELTDTYERLGSGTYGFVAKAHYKFVGDVAVKYFERDGQRTALKEYSFMHRYCSLHPHCVRVYGIVKHAKYNWGCVMELMEGGNLQTAIEQFSTSIKVGNAVEWMRQLTSAVAFLHKHGVAHRDVKPQNILLSADFSVVKLCDFGSTRLVADRMSMGQGTPLYIAPECLATSEYTNKCDVYSCAIVFWQLLTCRDPFDHVFGGGSLIIQLRDDPNLRPEKIDSDPELWNIIEKGWEADVDSRLDSASMFQLIMEIRQKYEWTPFVINRKATRTSSSSSTSSVTSSRSGAEASEKELDVTIQMTANASVQTNFDNDETILYYDKDTLKDYGVVETKMSYDLINGKAQTGEETSTKLLFEEGTQTLLESTDEAVQTVFEISYADAQTECEENSTSASETQTMIEVSDGFVQAVCDVEHASVQTDVDPTEAASAFRDSQLKSIDSGMAMCMNSDSEAGDEKKSTTDMSASTEPVSLQRLHQLILYNKPTLDRTYGNFMNLILLIEQLAQYCTYTDVQPVTSSTAFDKSSRTFLDILEHLTDYLHHILLLETSVVYATAVKTKPKTPDRFEYFIRMVKHTFITNSQPAGKLLAKLENEVRHLGETKQFKSAEMEIVCEKMVDFIDSLNAAKSRESYTQNGSTITMRL